MHAWTNPHGQRNREKIWSFRRRIAGVQTIVSLTLGTYPAHTIAKAREWAQELNTSIERGEDASQPIVIVTAWICSSLQIIRGRPFRKYGPSRNPAGSKTLPAKVVDNSNGQAGGQMTNEITFNLPSGMRHGVYKVASQVMVGANVLGTTQTSFVVV
jgi:hypothetical protein